LWSLLLSFLGVLFWILLLFVLSWLPSLLSPMLSWLTPMLSWLSVLSWLPVLSWLTRRLGHEWFEVNVAEYLRSLKLDVFGCFGLLRCCLDDFRLGVNLVAGCLDAWLGGLFFLLGLGGLLGLAIFALDSASVTVTVLVLLLVLLRRR